MTDDNAAQTRKSFVHSVKGKAKEVAGAVTGNDSLTAQGQLEQTEAKERRQASRIDAEADAEAAEARDMAAEAQRAGAQERQAAEVLAAESKTSVRTQEAAQQTAAEQAGRRDAARAHTQAEADVQSAALRASAQERQQVAEAQSEYDAALDEYRGEVTDAARAEAEADRLRRRAESADPHS
ncbi:CsbD family protein [Mycolicibacterium obuense]|uniref:General stress protein CsbD n=1 Tax=Mycolicibacterium obuense TaxID=1807 RepID=A0A0M2JPZ8_9MYCO|nr:CsbD family protein [Mycolicibacterium obuense]KKE99015.1 general stress protein CsbD [Mycolicibacterium obuense]